MSTEAAADRCGPGRTLLTVLREDLDLTGTKYGWAKAMRGLHRPGRRAADARVHHHGGEVRATHCHDRGWRRSKLHAVQEPFWKPTPCSALLHSDDSGRGAVAEQADPSDAEIVAGMNGTSAGADVSEDRPRRSRGGQKGGRHEAARFLRGHGRRIAVLLVDDAGAQQRGGRGGRAGSRCPDVGAWLHIGEDGVVTAYTARWKLGRTREHRDRGRGRGTALPVARSVIMGDTALTPFDGGTAAAGPRPTCGRRSGGRRPPRRDLLDLAAQKWNVDRASISMPTARRPPAAARPDSEMTQGQKLVQTIGECAATPARNEGAGDLGAKVAAARS